MGEPHLLSCKSGKHDFVIVSSDLLRSWNKIEELGWVEGGLALDRGHDTTIGIQSQIYLVKSKAEKEVREEK